MENIILTSVSLDEFKNDLIDAIKKEISSTLNTITAPTNEEVYLTRNQVARLLDISLGTISEWTKTGKLVGYRIGRRIRYKKSEIINSLAKIKTK